MIFTSTSKYMLKYQKAKAKLVEYSVSQNDYPKFNRNSNTLTYSAIYIISKYAEGVIFEKKDSLSEFAPLLVYAAQYFDAAESSKDRAIHSTDFLLSGASAYFFISDFGSSKVLSSKLSLAETKDSSPEYLLKLVFDFVFDRKAAHLSEQSTMGIIYNQFINCFYGEAVEESVLKTLKLYRDEVYQRQDPYDVYCVDLLFAIIKVALNNSSWLLLPQFSGISSKEWAPYLGSKYAISILWPSQQLICKSNILKGGNAVVQLPTGVGKTKSIELILRAAFISNRAHSAIIVAPLRALCNEITFDMLKAFDTSVQINQFSDVLQTDFNLDFSDDSVDKIYICTPEKLSYIIHHQPEVIKEIELFILDEGHMFDDGTRGARYEFLVSELRSSLCSTQQVVLLSAVLSNADQIREWLFDDTGVLATDPSIKQLRNPLVLLLFLKRFTTILMSFLKRTIIFQRALLYLPS